MRFLAILLALGTIVVAGCNTIEAVGKDLERGGEKVQDSAESVKNKM